jgi:hypothetical protein
MTCMIRSLKRWLIMLLMAMVVLMLCTMLAKAQVRSDAIQTFPLPAPKDDDAALSAYKKVLRAEIAIDSTTTVRFYEQPTTVTIYNSSISIERGGASVATYNIGSMIDHQALRLVHTALLRSGETGMLVCEYEGGAIGAREGFAILHFSPTGFLLHTLPLTDFGKVVVFKDKPEQVEIWSALPDDAGSNADERVYVARACHWKVNGYVCGRPKRQPGRFSPGDVDDPGIEIR